MRRWWIGKIAGGIGMFIVAVLLFSLVVMLLWNALVPDLFGGPGITYWQAVGLLVLSHILLRGWSPWRHRPGWRHERWRRRFEERFKAMSPEERERFRETWKKRCGWDPDGGSEDETARTQGG